jgi:hypothetical protein
MNLISSIYKKFTNVSNKLIENYESKFGLLCDLYFPENSSNPGDDGNYDEVNLFASHGIVSYSSTPDVEGALFYIPKLLKKEAMNSPESDFETFFEDDERPFLETSKKRELPIHTKVVVYLSQSKMIFTVEKKTVVQGADGHMLLRQYLNPYTGEN